MNISNVLCSVLVNIGNGSSSTQRDADEAEEARLAAGGVKSPTKAVGPSLLSRAPKSETRRRAILNMEVSSARVAMVSSSL